VSTHWKNAYLAWDTETTGLGSDARIVEIGSAAFSFGSLVGTSSSLFDPCLTPEQWKSPDVLAAMAANRLSPEDCVRAPQFKYCYDLVPGLFTYPDRACATHSIGAYVGHNVRFDLRMLRRERARLRSKACQFVVIQEVLFNVFHAPHFCTMGFDLALRPNDHDKRHNLGAVCERWGVAHGTLHRAVADAEACGRLLARMIPELPDDVDACISLQETALAERDQRYADKAKERKT
jgi:DNA polymerase III epsilon subunit-like protein